MRTQMRRVYSKADREQRLEEWRRAGVVQCFGWIEPLMPTPFSKVIWVPREKVAPAEASRLQSDAVEYLDGHLEAAPRRSGSFGGRYSVAGLDDLRARFAEGGPVVVTVDLDYFSGMEPVAQATAFERVWSFLTGVRNLRAVTIGISRPYLTGDPEAHRLVQLALEAAFSLPTATVEFEPFAVVSNDQSQRAKDLRERGKTVPFYDIRGAPEKLRAVILANRDRVTVSRDTKRWKVLLRKWAAEAPQFHVAVRGRSPSTDCIWRVPVLEPLEMELVAEPWDAPAKEVIWFALVPAFPSCNLTAQRADEGPFATGDPPRPRWKEVVLNAHGNTLSPDILQPFFDAKSGCGSVRVKAHVQGKGWVRETPVIELRRFAGAGFHAAITEQFGLLYLFGSGLLQNGNDTGPETGWGADCANFVVYALRRQGRCVPWSNPKQLRRYLEPVAAPAILGETKFTKEDVESGLIVHFGNHVAALMTDRPPLGVLDGGDLVAHHLEGVPEVVPLQKLLELRKDVPFDLLRVPHPAPESRILIGGDVMLARTVGERVKSGVDPFAGIRDLWESASLRVVNLECVISGKGTPIPGKHYIFRAPIEAARALRSAKVDVAGLANNHAGDCGRAALRDCVARLKRENIGAVGVTESPTDAVSVPFFAPLGNQRVAILAYNALEDRKTEDDAILSHEPLLQAIRQARSKANLVVFLVHWGEEDTSRVTDEQRSLARWLIDHGVDAIAGSHPHCIQPLESYHGCPVAYSLGNLVFDGAPALDSWSHGALLQISLTHLNPSPDACLIPIQLDKGGFPGSALDPPPTF
ncbi:MAG: CapA family protein [Chthoniobacteraceae bacterium]